jgi:Tfp pilus assembly protein PilN
VCALLLCLASAALGAQMVASKRAFDAQLAALRVRASAPAAAPVPAAGPAISAAQAAAVNGAVLQLNLPWRALHDAIGAATPRSIALLALEPDARKRTMRITAEAKTSDDMIAYVEQLKQQELFAAVVLTRHEINDQDPNKPIRFQLDAQGMAP